MNFSEMGKNEVLSALQTQETGLSAAQARLRQETHGENRLKEGKKVSFLMRVLHQLKDPMVLVLLTSAVVSGVLSGEEGKGDFLVILAVVVLNTVLGVVQESKAEAALAALRAMTPPVCHVIREGEARSLPASALVPGDIVRIEAGDAIPADGRLLEGHSLSVGEAALTGEAVPVEKDPAPVPGARVLAEQSSMLFLGTQVLRGRGTMVVTATGMQTEMGKIADSLSEAEEKTPLQKKLSRLSGQLTLIVLGICAVMFVLTLLRMGQISLETATQAFLLSVSLAVAAIPEGMVAVVTVVLSMGVGRMAKRNAIVRRLTAVETLGCTNVICTDKTGTLTANQMQVVRHTGHDEMLAKAMILCCDAEVGKDDGDPTEKALLGGAIEMGADPKAVRLNHPRIGEIPFDSARKRMTTFHLLPQGGVIQITKGAPDVMFALCTDILPPSGQIRRMDASIHRRLSEENASMAKDALRVIAVGYKVHSALPTQIDESCEKGLIYIGMMGMIDPIRPEVPKALAICQKAGIRVVMITGDHHTTAGAIASSLGLGTQGLLTGDQIDAMRESDRAGALCACPVFARVKPEHKMMIVDSLRQSGKITAMTGDGVNDAPALKHSDIGIGMGKSGSDVAKGCADLILADDNFATIAAAVEEGRRIWDNICKAIRFLLSSNLSEVLIVFVATILGVTVLEPIHLLFINLITDSIPALALGMEEAEKGVMSRPPRKQTDGIFSGGAPLRILLEGSFTALLTALSFLLGGMIELGVSDLTVALPIILSSGSATGRTMAFLTLALAETFHSLNMRSETASLLTMKQNRLLSLAVLASVAITAALLFYPPLTALFSLEQIPLPAYLLALAIAALILPAGELAKTARRRKQGQLVENHL